MSARLRPWGWLLLLLVIAVALVLGAEESTAPTAADRVDRLSTEVRCPTCKGQSVKESDAPAAESVRTQIRARVEAGESDDQIRDALVSSYGRSILLDPGRSGWTGLVWLLPLVAFAGAVLCLGLAFRRWRSTGAVVATADDVATAERARRQA